jgi:hypothetical protein
VYVDHTGPLGWHQRAWAACLLHPPAALAGASALRTWGVRPGAATDDAPVQVVVAHGRRLDDPPGVRTRVSRSFDQDTLLHLGPPRVRLEVAVVEVAAAQARRDDGGYDDIRYPAYGVRVELDGVLRHTDSADTWADQQRDLRTAATGDVPLRAGWRQVLDPCGLAAQVGSVLAARGWRGSARCAACDRGGSTVPGAVIPPRSA